MPQACAAVVNLPISTVQNDFYQLAHNAFYGWYFCATHAR